MPVIRSANYYVSPTARPSDSRWVLSIGAAIICSVLIGQRIAFTFGRSEVALCQFVVIAGLGILAAAGALRIHPMRLLLLSVFVFSAFLSAFNSNSFSTPSLLNVLVLYGSFVFCVDADDRLHASLLEWVHRCMAVIAVLAIVQFLIQLAGLRYIDLSLFLDESLTLSGFSTFYPINYGHWLNKSNGFFLLEPSLLSQFSTIALMLEVLGKRRPLLMALYCASLVVAFSGTGLVLAMFVAIPVFMRLPRNYKYVGLLGVAALVLWYFNTEFGRSVLERSDEFSREGSSATDRWIKPLRLMGSLADQEFLSVMVGHGPGTSVTDLSLIYKVIYEYGLCGVATYTAFILYCFFRDTRSRLVSSALFFMHVFLSGNFLSAYALCFYYVVLMFVPPQPASPSGQRARLNMPTMRAPARRIQAMTEARRV